MQHYATETHSYVQDLPGPPPSNENLITRSAVKIAVAPYINEQQPKIQKSLNFTPEKHSLCYQRNFSSVLTNIYDFLNYLWWPSIHLESKKC